MTAPLSLRAQNGALKHDFAIVFKSDVVISAAQKTAGTSEDIASYLTVKAVPDSNIIELIFTNPDQSTAKTYVDAVAKNALKTTSIVPVSSIQVIEYGDESNNSFKPGLYRNTAVIAGIAAAICLRHPVHMYPFLIWQNIFQIFSHILSHHQNYPLPV